MVMSDEETVLVVGNVKHKKQDGVIVMTRSRFAWSREGSSDLTVNAPYNTIKSHKISKDGSSKIQLQLVYLDGSTSNFHFAGIDPKSDRSAVSDVLVQSISKSSRVTDPEMEAKWKLLQDAGLYALYKDMVVSGIITAEEFWTNRCNDINSDQDQKSGLPSSFLADIQAVSGCNTVQYQLSTDIIENIFRTYPTVKERHSQLVPDKLTEEQFWVQFFQSQKFHRNRLSQKTGKGTIASSSSSNNTANGLFQECFEHDIESIKNTTNITTSLISTTDNPLEEPLDESRIAATSKQLVQRCNQHSALVLNAIQSDNDLSMASSSIGNTSEDPSLVLAIDQSNIAADTPPDTLLSMASQYIFNTSSTEFLHSSQAQSASIHMLPGGSLMLGDSEGMATNPSTIDSLCRYQRSLGELLRHFWACFPVINHQLEQKVHRMAQSIQNFRDNQLTEFSAQLAPSEIELMTPLITLIDKALTRYQDWISKQK